MKVMAVNGSPRKKWNTDTLLKNVLDGAARQKRRETVFPRDCKKAFELGVKLASE